MEPHIEEIQEIPGPRWAMLYAKYGVPMGLILQSYAYGDALLWLVYRSQSGPVVGPVTLELWGPDDFLIHTGLSVYCVNTNTYIAVSLFDTVSFCSRMSAYSASITKQWLAILEPTPIQCARLFQMKMSGKRAILAVEKDVHETVQAVLQGTSSPSTVFGSFDPPSKEFLDSMFLDDFTSSLEDKQYSLEEAPLIIPETVPKLPDLLPPELLTQGEQESWPKLIAGYMHLAYSTPGTHPWCCMGERCQCSAENKVQAFESFENGPVCLDCMMTMVRAHADAMELVVRQQRKLDHVPIMTCPTGSGDFVSPKTVFTILGELASDDLSKWKDISRVSEARKKMRELVKSHSRQ